MYETLDISVDPIGLGVPKTVENFGQSRMELHVLKIVTIAHDHVERQVERTDPTVVRNVDTDCFFH